MNITMQNWRICVVTDARLSCGRSHSEVVRAAIAGGADVIQFRDKEISDRSFLESAAEVRQICRESGIPFIVNDRVDIALATDADGIHVGQDDLPAAIVRKLIGPDKILGVSVTNVSEALAACAVGADYLGVGPVFDASSTKPDAADSIGLQGLSDIYSSVELPIVAIGGINAMNAGQVVGKGATGVAVISAVVSAKNIADAVRSLKSTALNAVPANRGMSVSQEHND